MFLRVSSSSADVGIIGKRICSKWLLGVLLVICSTSLDFATSVSRCVFCSSYNESRYSGEPNQNQPDCNGPNSAKFSVLCSDTNALYISGPGLGCQTIFYTAKDGITVERVFRGCINMEGFVERGLNITAARSPAGNCFPQPNFRGAQACVCADGDDCNVKPSLVKNTKGEFVASNVKPDQGGDPTPPGSNTDNSASSGDANPALDVANNQNASGTDGSQGATSDGARVCETSCNCGLVVGFCLAVIHLVKLHDFK